jgi:hypothetical protein
MMLGFIVRRCAADIGHTPTPDEFAAWANGEPKWQGYCLFGSLSRLPSQIMFRQPAGLLPYVWRLTRSGSGGSS